VQDVTRIDVGGMTSAILPSGGWFRAVATRNLRGAQGFALIDLVFVIGIIGVVATTALPRLLVARQSAGAASAIGSMRAINSAELTFALTCGGGFYAPKLTTLGTPPPGSREPYISVNLGMADSVTRAGYIVHLTATPYPAAPTSCNGLAQGEGGQAFKAGADPAEPGNPRYFATNANAQIYEDSAPLYPAMPEVGEPGAGHILR
jgi:type II secretory pathway pseudopilin PulG